MTTVDSALKAAGFIGIWNTDVRAARSILDGGAAGLLAGDAALAGTPLPLEVALQRTHPEDRGWVFERIRQIRLTGGVMSAEFRVVTRSGDVRWILNRGILAPDETGAMHGCGAYIDMTDTHPKTFVPANSNTGLDPLIEAADHALETSAAIARTGHGTLRQVSDALLMEIGRLLARQQRR